MFQAKENLFYSDTLIIDKKGDLMKLDKIIEILTTAIPYSESWVQENYGPQNIKSKKKEVKKILYCVTATQEVMRYFKSNNYDLLISHHPYVAYGVPQLIFHTALDCCKGGLNDMWAKYLGVQNSTHFDKNLGDVGSIDEISFEDLIKKIETFIGHKIIGLKYSNGQPIKSVVICTGLGGMVISEAAATKADCYITGELYSTDVKEFNFKAVIEVGHTLSEFMGVHLFRKLLPDLTIDSAPLEIDYFGVETSRGFMTKDYKAL